MQISSLRSRVNQLPARASRSKLVCKAMIATGVKMNIANDVTELIGVCYVVNTDQPLLMCVQHRAGWT